MNAASFFMENFGRHFKTQTGQPWVDVQSVLSGVYKMRNKASSSRLQSGWAIIRPGSATLKHDVDAPEILKSAETWREAFQRELDGWDGFSPRIFLLFDKAPIPASNIFLSVDRRHVRVCTNSGASIENWTKQPPKDWRTTK